MVWIARSPWEIISRAIWFLTMPPIHLSHYPMGIDSGDLSPCFLFIRRPLFTYPLIQWSRISPDPTVAIAPEFEGYSHDPSNPLCRSLTFYLLRRFCNAIPPEIFNSMVRVRSITMRLWPTYPTWCFNQKLWYQTVTYPATHELGHATFKPALGLVSLTDTF
jgi:hypothetical protein